MLAHSFLIKLSSKLLVTRTGIKARMSLISGLWFPWLIYMFLKWDLTLAHWTQVSDRCPLGYLFKISSISLALSLNLKGNLLWLEKWSYNSSGEYTESKEYLLFLWVHLIKTSMPWDHFQTDYLISQLNQPYTFCVGIYMTCYSFFCI